MIDNGPGISTQDQQKLFKMFGFLESTKAMNKKGIGLGLFICKTISEKFNGRCYVESEIGKGSNFSFSF